jgi:GTPase SAR1 family protein
MSIETPDEDIVLRHGFRTAGFKCLEDNVLVNTMNTHGDDVVALWAIRRSELGPRMVKEERAPLQNITNTAAGPKSTPGDIKAEERESRLSLITLASEMSNPGLVKGTAAQNSESVELAWVDFNCERRELLQRVKVQSTAQEVEEMDDRVKIEWLGLSDGQIKFFERRAHRIANGSSGPGTSFIQKFASSSRGFWAYYYDEFYKVKHNGLEPHRSFESTQLFFDSVLNRWLPMASGAQSTWIARNLIFLLRNPIRPMPVRSAEDQGAPTSAVKGEPSPEKAAALEPRDRSVSPSAALEADVNPAVSRSTSPPSTDDQVVSTRLNIPDLFARCTPEQLEKGVEKGVAILDRLKLALAPKNDSEPAEAGQWLQSIDNVRKQAVRTRTVIGVVGNTGAGKSSVINALLDEERLLPTNCMRACTAVITEISYNYDGTAYSAEIEFIAANDWRVELETLFKDLLDGSGNVSKDCTNEDSEAGIAYAKIKAVYPKLTREDISNSSVEALMKHANVSTLLGSSRAISETDSLIFYRKLQSFVDSKEKTTKSEKDKSDKERRKPREMEYWPLIKVVRLYVRSPALSTGAVIVDLPGVHDSNQARAAVAQNYMKQCTGLWICAPINRAVDDKAAKSLLGETFKRQLKMDGGYSTVTFICSKTDDISLMEAQDSLGIEDELAVLWNKCDELSRKKQSLKKELEQLKETKSDYARAMEAADEELEVWEKLKDDFDDGKTVYPPALKTKGSEKKRKRGRSEKTSNKKARLDDSDDDFIDDSHSEPGHASDEDSEIESSNEEPAEPLTEERILEKIGDLRATKKDGRLQRAQLDSEIKNVRALMDECGKDYDAAEAVIFQKCIQGRNEYSKGAIQQDFAAGIKELDMEIQEEEDAAHFNPEADVRDYDEVARSLPVFTVSSRAYQKLMGRLLKDKAVPGFATIQETQIPQLQEHAKKTTEAGCQANCRRFLNSLSQLLNSLRLWAGSDGSSSNLTELQKSQEAKILKDKLSKLDNVSTSPFRRPAGIGESELLPLASETIRSTRLYVPIAVPSTDKVMWLRI